MDAVDNVAGEEKCTQPHQEQQKAQYTQRSRISQQDRTSGPILQVGTSSGPCQVSHRCSRGLQPARVADTRERSSSNDAKAALALCHKRGDGCEMCEVVTLTHNRETWPASGRSAKGWRTITSTPRSAVASRCRRPVLAGSPKTRGRDDRLRALDWASSIFTPNAPTKPHTTATQTASVTAFRCFGESLARWLAGSSVW